MNNFSKIFILMGCLFIGIGIFLAVFGKIPGVGKLPGDFSIKKENFSFYFPLTTCIILSILLNLILRFFQK